MRELRIFKSFVKTAASKMAPTSAIQEQVDGHFSSADPKKWKAFRTKLKSPAFVTAVRGDDRADAKLKRFVERVGRHVASKDPGVPVEGGSGKKYRVKDNGKEGFSCSCARWTYVLAPSAQGGDCKHIMQIKDGKTKQAAGGLPLAVKRLLSVGWVDSQREKALDRSTKAELANRAYQENMPEELQPQMLPRRMNPFGHG